MVRWLDGQTLANSQATQVGLSIWWALLAATMLAWGFATRHTLQRYLALRLFALTIVKVLVVDLADVETVYRVLSLLASGALLIGASWLYQRYSKNLLGLAGATDDASSLPQDEDD